MNIHCSPGNHLGNKIKCLIKAMYTKTARPINDKRNVNWLDFTFCSGKKRAKIVMYKKQMSK